MYKINKDFDFLKEIFLKFFQQKHVINRLNDIERLNISGWEIWLQVECLFFSVHKIMFKKPIVKNDVLWIKGKKN